MKKRFIELPLLYDCLYVKVYNKRTQENILNTDDTSIENIFCYELVVNWDSTKLILPHPLLLEELKNCINNSSITTKYSRHKQSYKQEDDNNLITTVNIISLNFDWLSTISEFTKDNLIKLDHRNINKLSRDRHITLTSSYMKDYILVKFIMLSLLQVIDYYCKGYDCGKVTLSVNDAKRVALVDQRFNNVNESEHSNLKGIMNRLSFITLYSTNDTVVFAFDYNASCFYTAENNIQMVSLELEFQTYLYWKEFYNIVQSANALYQGSNCISDYHAQRAPTYYRDEIFHYNSISSQEFFKMSFEGVLIRKWSYNDADLDVEVIIDLYHDSITGERFITIDSKVVPSSYGISSHHLSDRYSLEHGNFCGHKIWFRVAGTQLHGYVEIRRIFFLDFEDTERVYFRRSCVINENLIEEFEDNYLIKFHENEYCRTGSEEKYLREFSRKKRHFYRHCQNKSNFECYPDWKEHKKDWYC